MAKNIIFCADGTWNSPGQDEDHDHTPDPTNVYKLFMSLAGALSSDSLRLADEQERELCDEGTTVQVAKYIHGVGDSRNPVVKLMGGAFGSGIISRIVRGYTFISRCYESGDRIHIIGFSRGAYTARALAGLICSQGLLWPENCVDREKAYRRGAEAWYRYRKATESKPDFLVRLAEAAADLPAFLSCKDMKKSDFVPVKEIASVAVWDTVGAMGIPGYVGDHRTDAFRFANSKLSTKVRRGFHAIALDERRCDFTPTLWDQAENVTQMVFPGAHADVGGGYPLANNESGLSDCALAWMIEQLKGENVVFAESCPFTPMPSPAGTAHMPWKHGPWKEGERDFRGWPGHGSISDRIKAGNVIADPGEAPVAYRPKNWP